LDKEKGFAGDGEPVFVEGLSRDEEVRDAEFVFEGNEAVTFGGAGTLSADDEAGDREGESVGELVEAGRGGEFLALLPSPESHRVRTGGGSLEGEVGPKSFER